VLTVSLRNPPRHYMDARMVGELSALIERIENDRTIGAVVITGAEPGYFLTHYDPAEIAAASGRIAPRLSARASRLLLRAAALGIRAPGRALGARLATAAGVLELDRALLRMNRMDKVFIAAINGLALGAGYVLAGACDIRLMAGGEHRVGLPEPRAGVIPATAVQRLSRAVGPAAAIELLLEGRTLSPQEALEAGLVHRVVDPARLAEEAERVARRMARRRPDVVADLKRLVYEDSSRRFADGLRRERAALLSSIATPSTRTALLAYMDRLAGEADPADHLAAWEGLADGTAVDLVEEASTAAS
jgi:enoyl-CoA hydratase